MGYSEHLEDVVRRTGGCGRFQWILCLLVHSGKTAVTWSMLAMTFMGHNPGFRCAGNTDSAASGGNQSYGNLSDTVFDGQCSASNATEECSQFQYDPSMVTLVTEVHITI